MRTLPAGLGGLRKDAFSRPEYVVQISWDADDADHTYLTSSTETAVPVESPAVDSISSVVLEISGQTQKINPDIATSTIGSVTITLLDRTDTSSPPSQLITDKIFEKLSAGDGLRDKIIRVYVGYREVDFTSYDLRLVYIIKSISYLNGVYTITASDIQRQERKKIFGPDDTKLFSSIGAFDEIIPVVTTDTSKFQSVLRGTETSNFPDQSVTFVKIEDEVVCINSRPQFDTTNGWHLTVLQRGALGTRAVGHTVDDGTAENRRPTITEHVYLEGAAPKVIYALETGILMHGNNVLTYPFDFTQWTASGATVVASSTTTPTGWGKAYDVTDDSGALFERIDLTHSTTYTHGDIWSCSIFIAKQVTSTSGLMRIDFNGGAATSQLNFAIDPSTGVGNATGFNATILSSNVQDFDDNWWYIRVAGFSTTTGTSSISMRLFPNQAGAAGTGTITVFCATLCADERMGWTVLPEHWHLGIHPDFVRLTDFRALGSDYWDPEDDSGRRTRIENPKSQDGKRFIEKEVLVWLGAFMPVYTTGELGIKRLTRVLSDGAYQVQLDKDNIANYSALKHSMESVINQIHVDWNYVDLRDEFTKENLLIDEASISIHQKADRKEYDFKTVHTGTHTDESMLAYFDTLRDRYSGPPLEMSLRLLPSMHTLEVGDTVKVVLDQVRDMNTGETISRTFEIQQISTNWFTGQLNVKLFGSSLAAGTLQRTSLSSVMEDEFYTGTGTSLDSSDSPAGPLTIVAGAVTVSGTVTGTSDMNAAGSIFYYDGDLTINAGVTVTIQNNVQLRIKGSLTVNGSIDGSAQGPAGGAATTLFDNASNTDTWAYNSNFELTNPIENQDIDYGSDGWFGVVQSGGTFDLSSGGLWALEQGQPPAYSALTFVLVNLSEVQAERLLNLPRKGSITTMPWFTIENPNGYSLTGIPSDLRGHGGPGGIAFTTSEYVTATATGSRVIRGNGGAGGAGGAGLVIICRGMSFGGSGEIDLSGADAGNPTSYTIGGAKTFYGGHGGPGSPGGFLLMIDGQYTNPDITSTNFIANTGSVGVAAGATELSLSNYDMIPIRPNFFAADVVSWPWTSSVFNAGSVAAIQDQVMWQSAHRIQYLPEAENIDVDFGPRILERGKFNELLRLQKTSPPAATQLYGAEVAITPDGSRFIVGDDGAFDVQVIRSAKDPTLEQTVGGSNPVTGLSLDSTGERFLRTEVTYSTSTGRVLVYARTGTTWALEQTILAGASAGAIGEDFGRWTTWDATGTHMIIGRNKASERIEYWSRSGATWTYQELITEPATVTNFGSGMAISGDGNWLAVADYGLNAGTVHLYERTANSPAWELRDSVTVPGYDLTSPITNYRMGYSGASTAANSVLINYDGTAIIVNGADTIGLGASYSMHTIERQGSKLAHLGILVNDDTWSIKGVSDNGLLVVISDLNKTLTLTLYRRSSVSDRFKFDHSFNNNDAELFGGSSSALSATGQFVMAGTTTSDIGALNSGHMEVWEYYPEAD